METTVRPCTEKGAAEKYKRQSQPNNQFFAHISLLKFSEISDICYFSPQA
jgi:hypothetical protein